MMLMHLEYCAQLLSPYFKKGDHRTRTNAKQDNQNRKPSLQGRPKYLSSSMKKKCHQEEIPKRYTAFQAGFRFLLLTVLLF